MTPTKEIERWAAISDDGRFRYRLGRRWGGDGGMSVTFVMLNPSTADGTVDDPTIRRCVGFARREECTRVEVVNLFAWRATKPGDLFDAVAAGWDIVGPENDDHVQGAIERADLLIAAWGATDGGLGRYRRARVEAVMGLVPWAHWWSLGVTKNGDPRHPLYMPAAAPLRRYQRLGEAL